jgi:hypothetical protein
MRAQTCAQHHISTLAPEGLDRLNPKLVQNLIGEMGTSYGDCVGVARAPRAISARPTRNQGSAAVPRKRENEHEAREYMDGTGRRNCREREV